MTIPEPLRSLRVALVHDYLNQPGGAEKVVEVFAEMFPGAPLYTSVYDRKRMPEIWKTLDIRTSFMQHISPRLRVAKAMFPLYPAAFGLFDLREYDLVLSSTTTFAKAVITRPETCHVCYCNNPTRFLWMYHDYFEHETVPKPVRGIMPWIVQPLRTWDFVAAQRVDYFVAGSHNARRRIAKYYRRTSDVVQPPIDGDFFTPSNGGAKYFLVAARLLSYKRIDLAVEACNRLGAPLHIAGEGPDRSRLESLAGPTVRFLGRVTDQEVRRQMACCRALIVPGEEDFGLTSLETQACGRPVVAYRAGGALETVEDGVTGLLFPEQTVDCLAETLSRLSDTYDPEVLRAHALRFDKPAFKRRMYEVLTRRYAEHCERFGPEY